MKPYSIYVGVIEISVHIYSWPFVLLELGLIEVALLCNKFSRALSLASNAEIFTKIKSLRTKFLNEHSSLFYYN